MSKSRNTARKSSGSESETDSLTMPQSGLMCELSMDGPSLAKWASSLPDSPASLIASPEGEGAQRMKGTSGRIHFDSLARWSLDTSSWRTYQASLLIGTLEPLSGSFLKSGMTVNGELFQQRTLARPIAENVGGVWLPTPQSSDWRLIGGKGIPQNGGQMHLSGILLRWHVEPSHFPAICEYVMMLPIGWTDLKPLATESYRQWQQSF